MHSPPKIPSTKVEAEENEVEEEEAEGPTTENRTSHSHEHSDNSKHLTTLMVRGGEARDGTICPIFSVTTTRSMDTMNEIAERSKLTRIVTRTIAKPMSLTKKKGHQR